MTGPLRRPPLAARTTNGCARPNCYLTPVIRFSFMTPGSDLGIVLSFCATHAENKAGQPTAEVQWLAIGWDVCPRCYRVLPDELVAVEHYNLQGRVCPPVLVDA